MLAPPTLCTPFAHPNPAISGRCGPIIRALWGPVGVEAMFRFSGVWPSSFVGLGSLDPNTFGYPSGAPLLPFLIAIGLISSRLDRRVFQSAACRGARKNVRNELLTMLFVGRWIMLVGALQSSQDLVLERAVQQRVRVCVCGGVIWSDVPRTRRCSYVPSKGRPDMSILMPGIYPKPRPVAQTHGKSGRVQSAPFRRPISGCVAPQDMPPA